MTGVQTCALPISNLKVLVAGSDTSAVWTGSDDKVSAGDSTDVAATPGQEVRVVYSSPDSDSSTTLQKFEVPE